MEPAQAGLRLRLRFFSAGLAPRQADLSATLSSASLKAARVARVQPRWPHALSSAANASGATAHLSACSSGVNLMLAVNSSGASVAKVTRALKARRSKC